MFFEKFFFLNADLVITNPKVTERHSPPLVWLFLILAKVSIKQFLKEKTGDNVSWLDHEVRSYVAEAGSDLNACVILNVHWPRAFIEMTVTTTILKNILNQSTISETPQSYHYSEHIGLLLLAYVALCSGNAFIHWYPLTNMQDRIQRLSPKLFIPKLPLALKQTYPFINLTLQIDASFPNMCLAAADKPQD